MWADDKLKRGLSARPKGKAFKAFGDKKDNIDSLQSNSKELEQDIESKGKSLKGDIDSLRSNAKKTGKDALEKGKQLLRSQG